MQHTEDKKNKLVWLEWFGTTCMLIAVCITNVSPTAAATSVELFWLFFSSHVCWSISGVINRNKRLMVMNFGLMPLDFYAMWIRW